MKKVGKRDKNLDLTSLPVEFWKDLSIYADFHGKPVTIQLGSLVTIMTEAQKYRQKLADEGIIYNIPPKIVKDSEGKYILTTDLN